MTFEKVKAEYDARGRRQLVPTGEPDQFFECDDVLVAVGQENAFPWIERDIGLTFDDRWDMPEVDEVTFQSTHPKVFFGGDAAFGPKNIIWAVAHGHAAAISIDRFCQGEDLRERPPPGMLVSSQKMWIHEWSYDNAVSLDLRYKVPHREKLQALKDIKAEVELGFDPELAYAEAQRCLNCDVQTVFTDNLCIECDACVDICPVDCITFTRNGEEAELRTRLNAPAQNLIYADVDGNIGYQAPGQIPIREGYDGKWPIPGWDSRYRWTGYIPFDALPSVYNPKEGWIVTANQAVIG
ncbi:MAG: penicillin acylase family protein [Rhodospirillales bacterium]|nr:penicillin acylase family protein [Rhodospirillales bacterium]